jgi:hypothetical protein
MPDEEEEEEEEGNLKVGITLGAERDTIGAILLADIAARIRVIFFTVVAARRSALRGFLASLPRLRSLLLLLLLLLLRVGRHVWAFLSGSLKSGKRAIFNRQGPFGAISERFRSYFGAISERRRAIRYVRNQLVFLG